MEWQDDNRLEQVDNLDRDYHATDDVIKELQHESMCRGRLKYLWNSLPNMVTIGGEGPIVEELA